MLGRRITALACFTLSLVAVPAAAQLHEPNGMQVPIDSSPEVQLRTLFANRGESIDWLADAHATPDVFSPLCGFTAEFVLNQAGSHFGLAWYNATGLSAPPTGASLHQIIAPNSPVGTMFHGTDIRSDPAYEGGLIGFALLGGETHYSQAQWDRVCTACSPPGPWITALVYASTATPNAYYVGFEDGNTSAAGWNNDGDFNDDVFFITGVTCSGGGAACDTGMQGVCAEGVQQCTDGGTLSCVPVVPSSPEMCNAIDDDCNGTVDDGTGLCPATFVCDHGSCVHSCTSGEFGCNNGLVCNADGFCVDPACAAVTCPAGTVCHAGTCRAPCDGVTCPFGQVCRVDRCVDPCDGVTCPTGQACDAGVCRESCTCAPCMGTLMCDDASGRCFDPACAPGSCAAGTHCDGTGACVDDCTGATCPPGQLCMSGGCVADPCASVSCQPSEMCVNGACVDRCANVTCNTGEICVNGTCMTDPCAGVTCNGGMHCVSGSCVPDGTGMDGGGSGTDGGTRVDSGVRHPVMSGGCCSVVGARPIDRGALLLVLVVLGLVVRRRRR